MKRPVTNEKPHWTRPVLVAEVRYFGVTDEGVLRAPIYLGLRDDLTSGPSKGPEAPAMSSARQSRAALDAIRAVPGSADKPPSKAAIARVRDQIDALAERGGGTLRLPDGGLLPVTNLAKRMWPRMEITKADLFRHYLDVALCILPVVRDRPLIMRRLPDGVGGHAFFQHRAPADVPAGVRRQAVPDDDVPSRVPAVLATGGASSPNIRSVTSTVVSRSASRIPFASR